MNPFNRYRIVAILTAYKRNYFRDQIESLLSQSIPPDLIIILQNESHIDLSEVLDHYRERESIKLIRSEVNTKFWGRFAIAQLFNSEFILILDDDIIPGDRWIENCLRLSQEKNCIVCANGRSYKNDNGFGDNGIVHEDIRTAFGGHSWFFRKEWTKYMWEFIPESYDTGEDITFCASAKIIGGIETWVPRQNLNDGTSAHQQNFSGDDKASWRAADWNQKRKEICEHFTNLGWK